LSSKISTNDGDTVANILWRYLGRDDDEVEEALFVLNPHLNELLAQCATLAANVEIVLPEVVEPESVKVVNIWD